jgi:hypothetical protein
MGTSLRTDESIIRIRTLQHKSTGALMAVSDDLPGFMVAGRTHDEIERKIEGAIRDHYDVLGCDVVSVTVASNVDALGIPMEKSRTKIVQDFTPMKD